MDSLQDRVIVVTGASRGIGAATARACLEAGASVAIASRRQEGLDERATDWSDWSDRLMAMACHMGHADEVAALFDAVVDRFGKVDGLVNNAGTNPYFGPMLGTSDAAFDKTFEVNVKGYLAAIRELVARSTGGSVVNIASIAGMRAAPLQGAYGMTKASVISMTQTLAVELGPAFRINSISPGLIETRLAAAIVSNDELREHVVGRAPLGRHGQPEEVAATAVHLLSDAASYVTGQNIAIDGGVTSV